MGKGRRTLTEGSSPGRGHSRRPTEATLRVKRCLSKKGTKGFTQALGSFLRAVHGPTGPLTLLSGGMERVCWNKEELLPTVVPQEVG